MNVGFSCRLPVTVPGGDGSYQGGFLDLPQAAYAPDPQGLITIDGNTQLAATNAAPVLRGHPQLGPPFYDAAERRWVPASAAQSSPDGASYAYAFQTGSTATFHVVNVVQATEKTFTISVPAPAGVNVLVEDYDGSGVFFANIPNEGDITGVWRLDVATGRLTALARVSKVMAVRHGYAWAGAVDPHDPNPPSAPGNAQDTIVQVNLSTGAATNWYYRLGQSVTLLGFAGGDRPIVEVTAPPSFSPANGEIRLIDHTQTSGGEDNGELVAGEGVTLFSPQADGDRVWFGSDTGIYLYTQAAGLQKVFAAPPGSQYVQPAGVCT